MVIGLLQASLLGSGGIDDLEFTFYAQRTIKEVLKEIKVTYEKE